MIFTWKSLCAISLVLRRAKQRKRIRAGMETPADREEEEDHEMLSYEEAPPEGRKRSPKKRKTETNPNPRPPPPKPKVVKTKWKSYVSTISKLLASRKRWEQKCQFEEAEVISSEIKETLRSILEENSQDIRYVF
jgi:hypothetical protein